MSPAAGARDAGSPARHAPGAHPPLPRVVAIIPALDEAAALARLLPEVPRDVVAEVLVVDNGSRDATAAVARGAGARVVAEPRRGYGRACLAGLRAAAGADVVVYLDGDYSDDPRQIPRLLGPLWQGRADLVVGTRGAGAGLPLHQRLGNALAMALLRLLFGVRLGDPGSFRLARRETLLALGMEHPTYGWPVEMLVKAARRGYRVVGVPVPARPRWGGRSKVGGTLRGSVLAGWHMLATIVRYAGRGPRGRRRAHGPPGRATSHVV
jgi:glycosyltransferase involved in cell wall biosynthesis